MHKAPSPGVPLWKRLVIGACLGGAVFLTFSATEHWHLSALSSAGLAMALLIAAWLLASLALGLTREW